VGDSLKRLFGLIDRLPRRSFELSDKEARMLVDALEVLDREDREAAKHTPPESAMDMQSDSEALALNHDLRQRLLEFQGYTRKPRA
jgi:hypothetical protein